MSFLLTGTSKIKLSIVNEKPFFHKNDIVEFEQVFEQDLENRFCKTPHWNNINKTIQLDNIANKRKSPLLKENNTSLGPDDIDFNLSITDNNQSTFYETRKVNASVINGNELSIGTQIQKGHHRNHLHQKAFPMIHLSCYLGR